MAAEFLRPFNFRELSQAMLTLFLVAGSIGGVVYILGQQEIPVSPSDHNPTTSEVLSQVQLGNDTSTHTMELMNTVINTGLTQANQEYLQWLSSVLGGTEQSFYTVNTPGGQTLEIIAGSQLEAVEAAQALDEELASLLTFSARQSPDTLAVREIDIEQLRDSLSALGESAIEYEKHHPITGSYTETRDINIERAANLAYATNRTINAVASYSLRQKGFEVTSVSSTGSCLEGTSTVDCSDADILIKVPTRSDFSRAIQVFTSMEAAIVLQDAMQEALDEIQYMENGVRLTVTYIHILIHYPGGHEVFTLKIPFVLQIK